MAAESFEKMGRYELITRIAAGGMAEIFLARERGLIGFERYVVIKRILPHLSDDPPFIAMFLREARIVARLNHPNIVQIFDLGEEEGQYYLAMEYIHGCTLRELQVFSHREDKPVPTQVAVALVAEACRGLHEAHELRELDGSLVGLVHRDISPQNLMVTPHGHVKLLDFGIAKGEAGFETTKGEGIRGKYGYMSPEQCRRLDLDRRSDVFSLAVILWELCANEALFKRDSELDMMNAIINGEAHPVMFSVPGFPPELDAVIMKALETDPDLRYDSAESFRIELTRVARELGFDLSFDHVSAYVQDVAEKRLSIRDQILEKAKEHSLTDQERRRLIHATDDAPRSFDSDIADVFLNKERELFHREQERKRNAQDDAPPTTETTQDPDENDVLAELPSSRAPLVLAALALLVIGGVIGFFLIGGSGESTEEANAQGADETSAVEETPDASPQPPPVQYTGPPLIIGWPPTVDPEVLETELEPLRQYLETTFQRPVQFPLTKDYGELADKVLAGDFHFGVFPPLLYVRTSMQPEAADMELMAIKEFEGSIHSDGYILVRHDSRISTLNKLEGKTFCFTDKDSTTGNFLPRAHIRAAGFDPDAFIGEVHWSGGHLQVMRDLLAQKCDAAATYSGAFLTAGNLGIQTAHLRIFAITGQVPQDVIASSPTLPFDVKRDLKKALLSFDPVHVTGDNFIGENQRISGFSEGSQKMFEPLREAVAAENETAGKKKKKKKGK